jgi:hypothetical protein
VTIPPPAGTIEVSYVKLPVDVDPLSGPLVTATRKPTVMGSAAAKPVVVAKASQAARRIICRIVTENPSRR